jgi:hypothetical protein
MSETAELEKLLNEKSNVEKKGCKLDDQQRRLNTRAKVLTEKIIHELRIKNDSKKRNLKQLQSTIKDLELQLNALTVSTVLADIREDGENSEESVDAGITFSTKPQETITASEEDMEDTVFVTEATEEKEESLDELTVRARARYCDVEHNSDKSSKGKKRHKIV